MNEQLMEGIEILIVGMITVFIVLGLVVLTGKFLIWSINKLTPDAVKKPVRTSFLKAANQEISQQKIAAIVAAVDVITKGQGKITTIKKVE